MSDKALELLDAIEHRLNERVPLLGGWHSTPRPGVSYPYGTFFIPRSTRGAGNIWSHWGIVNVWCREGANDPKNKAARDAYVLSRNTLTALDGGFPVTGFRLFDFLASEPARELTADGVWRGWLTFTATTT